MFAKRRLAVFALLFTAGIGLGIAFPDFSFLIGIVAAAIGILFWAFSNIVKDKLFKSVLQKVFIVPILFCVGVVYLIFFETVFLPSEDSIPDDKVYLEGVIEEVRFNEYYNSVYAKIKVTDSQDLRRGAVISAYVNDDMFEPYQGLPDEYDIIGFYALLNSDVSATSRADGISLYADIEVDYLERKEPSGLEWVLNIFPSKAVEYFDSVPFWDAQTKGLAKTIVVNDTTDMDVRLTNSFRRSGIVHFLAISGFHMTIVTGAFLLLLRLFRVGIKVRIPLSLFFAFVYSMTVGFVPSVSRSFLMLAVTLIGVLLSERNDIFTSMSFALVVILILNPFAVADIGLQLSFLSVTGIATALNYLKKLSLKVSFERDKHKILAFSMKYIVTPFAVTLFAYLFTLPIVFSMFGEITAISPVFNLIASPFLSLILVLMFLGALLGVIYAPIAAPFSYIAGKICEILFRVSYAVSSKPALMITESRTMILPLILLIGALVFVLFASGQKQRKRAIVALVAAILVFGGTATFKQLYLSNIARLTYINREKSSHLVVSSGATHVLFDFDSVNLDYKSLSENGYIDFAACVFTSYSSRMISNAKQLVAKNNVQKFYLPEPLTSEYEYVEQISDLAKKYSIAIEFYDQAKSITVGKSKGTVRFFSAHEPDKGFAVISELNRGSVIFAGAAEKSPSGYLADQYASVLILSEEFMKSPDFSILPDTADIPEICAIETDVYTDSIEKAISDGSVNAREADKLIKGNSINVVILNSGKIRVYQ